MKKLITIILLTSLIFAFEVRDSESGQKPDRFRNLQGGVLIAYNIEKVETDSTLMFEYDEILIKKESKINEIPAEADLTEIEKEQLKEKL